jgi:hypothetical protein
VERRGGESGEGKGGEEQGGKGSGKGIVEGRKARKGR